MKRKYKIIIGTYTLTAIVALGAYSFAAGRQLRDYELAAKYSAARAFEETVQSVDSLSMALEKCRYATDSEMKSRLCADAFAGALAAETAMSTLPFSNYRLEQLNAFLNLAGDYAYTLGRQGGGEIKGEQAETLSELSQKAADFSRKLRELQSSVNSGEIIMDSMHKSMSNLDSDGQNLVSQSMLEYEGGLGENQLPQYDGKYRAKDDAVQGELSEDEMRAQAAAFAGVQPQQLKEELAYSGTEGRMCYSAGDTLICVSPIGVESLGQTRLVSELLLDPAQAQRIAEDYLKEHGFENLSLSNSRQQGAVAVMNFAATEDGVLWPDNYIKVAIALDDGSVYSFDAKNYTNEESGVSWSIDRDTALKAVPESLSVSKLEKQIIRSPGGENKACYKIACIDEKGDNVELFVDGNSGKQLEITLGY